MDRVFVVFSPRFRFCTCTEVEYCPHSVTVYMGGHIEGYIKYVTNIM